MLRTKLLSTGIFLDNEYFTKYLNLVTKPINTKAEEIVFEQHHILPVSYFKHNNLEVDNSPENLVFLDIQNHVLAHYYLALCSAVDWFYYGNAICVNLLTNRSSANITEDWIKANLIEINNIKKYRLYLNSTLQKGLQAAEKNPNCKYSAETCEQVKYLLTTGMLDPEISLKTAVPIYLIKRIRLGKHWSCKEDNFRFTLDDTSKLLEAIKIEKWKASNPSCLNCGKQLEVFIGSKLGDGCFCSKKCSLSMAAKEKFKRNPELKAKIIANRDYSGKNNPNFGKKATIETREKISKGVKNSTSIQNSKRFSGKSHTEESKKRTSEALKKNWAKRKTKEN